MINTASAAFLVFFALFFFIAYVMLYALTRLPKTDFAPMAFGKEPLAAARCHA